MFGPDTPDLNRVAEALVILLTPLSVIDLRKQTLTQLRRQLRKIGYWILKIHIGCKGGYAIVPIHLPVLTYWPSDVGSAVIYVLTIHVLHRIHKLLIKRNGINLHNFIAGNLWCGLAEKMCVGLNRGADFVSGLAQIIGDGKKPIAGNLVGLRNTNVFLEGIDKRFREPEWALWS